MNSREQNWYYGDNTPEKRKKRDEEFVDNSVTDDGYYLAEQESFDTGYDMQAGAERMKKEYERWSAPVDKAEHERRQVASARNYLAPEDSELRRRRLFVMSDNNIKEATDGYYTGRVSDVYKRERKASEDEARAEYLAYATVPGADPLTSLAAMRRKADPAKTVRRTMSAIEGDEALDSIARSYANYAGLSPDEYRDKVLKPHIESRVVGELVDEATPKSSLEYMTRSAVDNSLTGKLTNWALDSRAQTSTQTQINREGLNSYNAGRGENLASGIGSLLYDAPMFSAIGGVSSKAVSFAGNRMVNGLAGNLVKKYASRGMQLPEAQRIIERAVVGKIGSKILGSSATQGLTLGGYDASNSLADDLLYNDGIDVNKAVNAFAHGLGTGTLLGVVGTPLKEMSRGLTGGRKIAASTGILGAESAVFTLGSTLEKTASGVEVEPIDLLYDFGESATTLGVMRLAHWRPKGAYIKLDATGRLKGRFRLNNAEKREIIRAGINPNEFVKELEHSFTAPMKEGGEPFAQMKSDYLKLMSSDELSASTRSKLLYLVENKVTSTPPVAVDYKVEELPGGGYNISLIDANGFRVESKEVADSRELKRVVLSSRPELRKNKIANYEKILLGKYDSENFFRQAGIYSKESGVPVDVISEAMYKKASGTSMSAEESKIIDDISSRTTYGDKGVGQMLYDIRRGVENEFGLRSGALLTAINKKPAYCTPAENRALYRYADIMRQEADAMANGASPERANELASRYKEAPYDWFEGATPEYSVWENISVPRQWNKPYAWSYAGVRNSTEDMRRMQTRANELASRLGSELNFIFDERAIPVEENVGEYNNKIRSMGWVDNNTGKVYINLPNIANMKELEKTVLHEVVGHGGLSKLFGEYVFDFYDDVYRMADRDVKAKIHEIAKRNGRGGYSAIEEYLAEIAENGYSTPEERSILARFGDFAKRALSQKNIFFSGGKELSHDDVKNLLVSHREAMQRGSNPDDYRSRVFSRFPSAKRAGNYYNADGYKRALGRGGTMLDGTPDFLWGEKAGRYGAIMENGYAPAGNSYKFIGVKGAENLRKRNIKIPGVRDLDYAEDLEILGLDPKKVWERTGWFQGADGEWRAEINGDYSEMSDVFEKALDFYSPRDAYEYRILKRDFNEEPNVENMDKLAEFFDKTKHYASEMRLGDLIKDELFYAAYPELKALPLQLSHKMIDNCAYVPEEKTLYVNIRALADLDRLKPELTKSMQQMIQHYEGFPRGIDLHRAMDTDNSVYTGFYNQHLSAVIRYKDIVEARKNKDVALVNKLTDDFVKRYGMEPKEYFKLYPSFNEYMLNKMYGRNVAFSGDVEVRNAMRRENNDKRYFVYPLASEDFNRKVQINVNRYKELGNTLLGPIDIILKNIKEKRIMVPMDHSEYKDDISPRGETPFEDHVREIRKAVVRELEMMPPIINKNFTTTPEYKVIPNLFYNSDKFGWERYKKRRWGETEDNEPEEQEDPYKKN